MVFPPTSAQNLSTCDQRLQDLFNRVVQFWPCIVAVGFRGEQEQDAAVAAGLSKDPWPTSKHNASPSLAADVVPSPVDWKDTQKFVYFAGFVKGVAALMGIPIRWGGDWSSSLDPEQNKFNDLDHFEIADQ